MMRRTVLSAAISLCLMFAGAASSANADKYEQAYAALLKKYVVAGKSGVNLVGYSAWSKSEQDLETLQNYLTHLQSLKPSQMKANEAFAFWINLYNAATLKLVLDHYPVRSIRDIKSSGTGLFDLKAFFGPWRTKLVTVEGVAKSLDDIEHETLRKRFGDPRIHYAVNCASMGCPNLRREPWKAETLVAVLDEAARAYVNHPRGVSFTPDGKLKLSSIYVWFKDDFGGTDRDIIRHLRRYASPELRVKLKGINSIAADDYDWSLNDAR